MTMRTTIAAVLLAASAFVAVGCEDDGGEENFETDNEVDGGESETQDDEGPAGTVDSREPVEEHQDGDDAPEGSTTITAP